MQVDIDTLKDKIYAIRNALNGMEDLIDQFDCDYELGAFDGGIAQAIDTEVDYLEELAEEAQAAEDERNEEEE
jgi:Mg2+ and Co2+ transporter CorA